MHGNQYIFGGGGQKNRGKHKKRAEGLECSSSFILPYAAHVHRHTSLPLQARTQSQVLVWRHYACTAREMRKGICPDQQIIHSFLFNCPCGNVQCVMANALLLWFAGSYSHSIDSHLRHRNKLLNLCWIRLFIKLLKCKLHNLG